MIDSLDAYATSTILRQSGYLEIPFEQVINSPYFKRANREIPKSKIQYNDGVNRTIGWGENKRAITDADLLPLTKEEMLSLLGLERTGSTAPTRYWTFFCNPAKWEIDKFLETGKERDTYQVTAWQQEHFAPGQFGVIRVGQDSRTKEQLGGRNRLVPGVYALVEVVSASTNRHDEPDKFWTGWTEKEREKPIVEIRFVKSLLTNPLRLEELKEDKAIQEDKYLVKGFQAASMPLQKGAFNRIVELIGEGEQLFESVKTNSVQSNEDIIRLEEKYKYAAPQVKEVVSKRIERGAISTAVKKLYEYKCKVCEALGVAPYSFKKENGDYYVETHHIDAVSNLNEGSLGVSNLITVCANHHRQLHYGSVHIVENTADSLIIEMDGQEVSIQKKKL